MKNINKAIALIAVHLGLATSVALGAAPAAVLRPPAGINLEYIGQGLVVSPSKVYQYGYFTHVAGVENLFSGAPNNASTAFFTFLNELSTTRVTDNGPLRIVDRKGTATIYINPAGGANFEDPASFSAGTPVLTAALRHQVILDPRYAEQQHDHCELRPHDHRGRVLHRGRHQAPPGPAGAEDDLDGLRTPQHVRHSAWTVRVLGHGVQYCPGSSGSSLTLDAATLKGAIPVQGAESSIRARSTL